jgi:hypothetical protein
LEIDAVLEGTWGKWATEIKTGPFTPRDLTGLREFVRRFPSYRPLVVCNEEGMMTAEKAGVAGMTWSQFLWEGPPKRG